MFGRCAHHIQQMIARDRVRQDRIEEDPLVDLPASFPACGTSASAVSWSRSGRSPGNSSAAVSASSASRPTGVSRPAWTDRRWPSKQIGAGVREPRDDAAPIFWWRR